MLVMYMSLIRVTRAATALSSGVAGRSEGPLPLYLSKM
jgi:hypothetical protein